MELKRIDGTVIFENGEINSISNTVKEYIKKELSDGKSSADLRYANLRYADLSSADLRYANLRYADLSSANLSSANLSSADLRYADLRYANLRYADLSSANLRYADLRYANLSSANLSSANLSSANLSSADLRYADLSSANLRCANLSGARNLLYSACYFSGHGECGRQLLAIKIKDEIKLFCGCFKGNESELREYIEKGQEIYKASRLLALETVLKLIEKK